MLTPPTSMLSGTTRCTSYQMLGRVSSRCGSPASRAVPVAERAGATAQLLLAKARASRSAASGSRAHASSDGASWCAVSAATSRAAPLSGAPGAGMRCASVRGAGP